MINVLICWDGILVWVQNCFIPWNRLWKVMRLSSQMDTEWDIYTPYSFNGGIDQWEMWVKQLVYCSEPNNAGHSILLNEHKLENKHTHTHTHTNTHTPLVSLQLSTYKFCRYSTTLAFVWSLEFIIPSKNVWLFSFYKILQKLVTDFVYLLQLARQCTVRDSCVMRVVCSNESKKCDLKSNHELNWAQEKAQ